MKAALLAMILGLVAITQASALTGAQLYQFCVEAPKRSLGDTACATYVRGFIDGLVMGALAVSEGHKICIPADGISVTQGRLILEKTLREHPEFLHEEAGYLFGSPWKRHSAVGQIRTLPPCGRLL